MKKLLLAAAAALSLAYARISARILGGPMDGSAWEVRVRPDALFAFSHSDILVFDQGRMTVAGFLASGFSSATYSAQAVDGPDVVFDAVLIHSEKGAMNWQGFVRGDTIEGVAVLREKDGRTQRFLFKGSRKTA